MYKQDLALNNLQGLTCHESQPTETIKSYTIIAQSARAVENIDCISAEGQHPPPSMSVLDMTINNLMVRLQ